MLTDTQWEALVTAAQTLGTEYGTGSTVYCDLSGQWADEPTCYDILRDIIARAQDQDASIPSYEDWDTDMDQGESELLDTYEDAHNTAAADTVTDEDYI